MDFAHYWQYTDAVSKTLFFILIALSVISWIVGVTRLLKSRQAAVTISDDLSQKIASDTKGLDLHVGLISELAEEQ